MKDTAPPKKKLNIPFLSPPPPHSFSDVSGIFWQLGDPYRPCKVSKRFPGGFAPLEQSASSTVRSNEEAAAAGCPEKPQMRTRDENRKWLEKPGAAAPAAISIDAAVGGSFV